MVLRKAKHELGCLQRVSEILRDTRDDSFVHISWFKTRKTSDLHLVTVQQIQIVTSPNIQEMVALKQTDFTVTVLPVSPCFE